MIRKFLIGDKIEANDPDPTEKDLSRVFELLVMRFPLLRHSALFESDGVPSTTEPNTIVYKVPLVNKAMTNG